MAGLLDFLSSPEMQMGIGLLSAGGPRTDPNQTGLGTRLADAMGYVQKGQAQQNAEKRAQMQDQMMQVQMDNYRSEIDARKLAGVKDARQQALIESLMGGGSGQASQPTQGAPVAPSGAPQAGSQPGVIELARQYGIPEKAIQADMVFNGGKKIAELLAKHGAPDMQVTNGYAYDKNRVGAGYLPSLSTSQDGKTSMVQIGLDGLPVVSAPKGAMETFGGYQGAQAAFKPIKVFNPITQREEYTNEGAVVGGQRPAPGGAPAGYATEPQMRTTASGPMGADPAALAREIKAVQADLMKPMDENSRAMLRAHLETLTGQSQRVGQSSGGNFAAGPSATETASNEALKAGAVTQANANVKPMEARANSMASTDYMIKSIDKLIAHPGLSTGTGFSGTVDPRNYIAGTDAKNFKVALGQVQGGTFLQAFESLKGGGAVSEIEGAKASSAIARLDTAQSETEFRAALTDFKEVMTTVQARQKAAMPGGGATGGWGDEPKPKAKAPSLPVNPSAQTLTKGQTYLLPNGKEAEWDGMRFRGQ